MRTNIVAWLILFAVLDVVIPLPILAVLLIWIALKRPAWFADLVRRVYSGV